MIKRNIGDFSFPDSRSKTACRGFEPFCPCQKSTDTPKGVSVFFWSGRNGPASAARRISAAREMDGGYSQHLRDGVSHRLHTLLLSRSAACRATPASAAGGGYSEQGLAQRSKKSRKSGSPKIFSGTARGVAKQLRALLPLPDKKGLRLCGGLSCFIEQKRTRGMRSVPGNACSRRRWRIQRAGVGAAVEKIEEKRQPEDFFGHRKRADSSPSVPATEKALKPLGFGAFSSLFCGRRTVRFAAFRCAKMGLISHPAASGDNHSVCYIINAASLSGGFSAGFPFFLCLLLHK